MARRHGGRLSRALVGQGLPITRACAAAGISRSSFHYESRRTDDVELLERIKEIREKKPRWGYKRVHAKLRKEGFVVNHKRVERIWRDYGFTLSARRRRKKVRTGETVPEAAYAPNHVWTYDFMFDATHQGRRMKVLSIVDEFTREALSIVPARSLTASAVKGVLARLFTDRGRPATLRRVASPPARGAWIETCSSWTAWKSTPVAPRAGAWTRTTTKSGSGA